MDTQLIPSLEQRAEAITLGAEDLLTAATFCKPFSEALV